MQVTSDLEGDPMGEFSSYGVLGVVATVLMVSARAFYNRELMRAERLEAEVAVLNAVHSGVRAVKQIYNAAVDYTQYLTQSDKDWLEYMSAKRLEEDN